MSPYASEQRPRPPQPARAGGALLSLFALVTALTLLGYVLWQRGDLPFAGRDPARPVQPRGELSDHERTIIEIFEQASPSVVFVSTRAAERTGFYGTESEGPLLGAGTGFVWDGAGHIVTNFHVVEPAQRNGTRPLVTLPDQHTYEAEIVGTAASKDLAVLRIDAPTSDLRPLLLGTSADLQVGQTVLAIGNPFGLDQTLTVGVVSALERTIRSPSQHRIEGVIQTDAAINPGNSGGPLLDSAGRLIGVNTMIYSKSGSSSGIGFAVPADEVRAVVPEIILHGRVLRPGLGVELSPRVATRGPFAAYGRPASPAGVEVGYVGRDSAADEAGLQGLFGYTRDPRSGELVRRLVREMGDIIQAVDGKPVRSRLDLLDVLGTYEIGDEVTLTVWREGRELEIPVVLQGLDG